MNTTNLKSFHYLENGEIMFSTLDTIKSGTTLDSGFYILEYIDNPNEARVVIKKSNDTEYVKSYLFDHKEELDNIIESFLDRDIKKRINDLGFNHKVGILLHGREGTGKSSIIKHYCNNLIRQNKVVVFNINSVRHLAAIWNSVIQIRKIQDNLIVIVFDEFDTWVDNKAESSKESLLKKILDGSESIDNMIVFGSTNYIDTIPKAIKNRRSRFKYSLEICGINDIDSIKGIIDSMLSNTYSEVDKDIFANYLQGSTLDDIKQFCLDKIMCIKSKVVKDISIGFKI